MLLKSLKNAHTVSENKLFDLTIEYVNVLIAVECFRCHNRSRILRVSPQDLHLELNSYILEHNKSYAIGLYSNQALLIL